MPPAVFLCPTHKTVAGLTWREHPTGQLTGGTAGRDPTRPLITDSGGFQVFSLAFGSVADDLNVGNVKGSRRRAHAPTLLNVNEGGVTFRSYRDGQRVFLTPESTVQHQKKLGADIIIPLDELPPYRVSKERLRESLYLSHRWEARSLREHLNNPKQQAMYAVVHGGVDRELRQESIDYLSSLPFEGFAMGGSFGKLGDELADIVGFMAPQLPDDRPKHLLGIADLPSIRSCVVHGVDTFDSAFPSRNGRHGSLLTHAAPINIANRSPPPSPAPYPPARAAAMKCAAQERTRTRRGALVAGHRVAVRARHLNH